MPINECVRMYLRKPDNKPWPCKIGLRHCKVRLEVLWGLLRVSVCGILDIHVDVISGRGRALIGVWMRRFCTGSELIRMCLRESLRDE